MRCHGWQTICLFAFALGLWVDTAPAQQVNASSSGQPQVQPASAFPAPQRLPQATADSAADNSSGQGVSLGELQRRLEATEAELTSLRRQAQATPAAFQASAPTDPAVEQGEPLDMGGLARRLGSVENFLRQGSNPNYPTFRLNGFLQLDNGNFIQSAASKAEYGNIQDGTGFRRARLIGDGNVTDQTKYWVEVDFAAAGRPSFMDVWGEQSDLPGVGTVRVGQYRQPVSLDGAVNVRHLEFMEYSSVFFAFDPFRRVGIGQWFVTDDQRSFLNCSVYGTGATFYNGTNPNNGATVYNSLGGDNLYGTTLGNRGISFAARGTHLLYWDELTNGRTFLAAGAGYNYSTVGGSGTTGPDAHTYQAQTIPEFFVGDPTAGGTTAGGTPNTLNTGRFLANNFSIYHLESCGSYGAAHFQSEYIATVVSQLSGPSVFLDGAYFQCGYFLTGENVGYNRNMGAIDYQVEPFSNFFGLGRHGGICGWGAWELAARVSYLDLNGDILAKNQVALPGSAAVAPNQAGNPNPFTVIPGGGGINQGQMTNMTLGVNWWWNPFTKVVFNYIYSDVHSSNGGDGTVTPAGLATHINYGVNTLHILAARFQVEF